MNKWLAFLFGALVMFGCRKETLEPTNFPGFMLNGVNDINLLDDGTIIASNNGNLAVIDLEGTVNSYHFFDQLQSRSLPQFMQFFGNSERVYAVNEDEVITMEKGAISSVNIEATINDLGHTSFYKDAAGNLIRTDLSESKYFPSIGQYLYRIRLSKWDGYWQLHDLNLWVEGFNLPIYFFEDDQGTAYITFEQYVFRGSVNWEGESSFEQIEYNSSTYIPAIHNPLVKDNHLYGFNAAMSSTVSTRVVYDLDLLTNELNVFFMRDQTQMAGLSYEWLEIHHFDVDGVREFSEYEWGGEYGKYAWATYQLSDHTVVSNEYAYPEENNPRMSNIYDMAYDPERGYVYFGTEVGLYRHDITAEEFVFMPELLLNEK